MSGSKQLFRKKSLERLSSPEQLDTLIQITSPVGWLALAAVGFLMAVVITWGFLGSIHEKAQGHGYLIKEVEEITPGFEGRVSAIHFKRGDHVSRGDIVADISQADTEAEIEKKEREIEQIKLGYSREIDAINVKIETQASADLTKKETLEQAIKDYAQKVRGDVDELAKVKRLLKQGIRTGKDVRKVQNSLAENKNGRRTKADELEQMLANEAALLQTRTDRESARDRDLTKMGLELERLLEQKKATSQIKSHYTGRVLEVKVKQYQLIKPETSILILEKDAEQIQLIAYSPVMLGKKVQVKKDKGGLVLAHISPTHVKVEEFGFIIGKVESISSYVVSREGMAKNLRNDSQVENLRSKYKDSDLLELKVSLFESQQTVSGFKWTSSDGPPYKIGPGAECKVKFIVNKKRPIELVIPKIKGMLGLI